MKQLGSANLMYRREPLIVGRNGVEEGFGRERIVPAGRSETTLFRRDDGQGERARVVSAQMENANKGNDGSVRLEESLDDTVAEQGRKDAQGERATLSDNVPNDTIIANDSIIGTAADDSAHIHCIGNSGRKEAKEG